MGRAGGNRIEFATVFNVRDLGGYRTPFGTTRPRRFMRAGDTMFLSDDDLHRLLDLGVRRVVDLRMGVERPELSDRLAHVSEVTWSNAVMVDERAMTPEWTRTGRVVAYLLEGYRRMLLDYASIRTIFSFMSQARRGECVLFHCASGMDRTGLVSALVLGVAGVSREDLVADYAYAFASDEEADEALATWDPALPPPPHDGTLARIHTMFATCDWLVRQYGSVRQYLLQAGVAQSELDRIVAHLLGTDDNRRMRRAGPQNR
ncbi:MAG: tyrosine-protein phosphatase [Coriobacteriales bacterium]|nr:tyrosine-protein phosphatase [Coriobacteriales bacterium]